MDTVARGTLSCVAKLSTAAASVTTGTARDRALTCVLAYELLARFHPGDFHILEYLGYPWVFEVLPDDLRNRQRQTIAGLSRQLGAHVQDAADSGELELAGGASVATTTFHTIAFVYGAFSSIIKNRMIFQLAESTDAWNETRAALSKFWDGNGWAPSGKGSDDDARADDLLKNAFPEYWLKVKTGELAREVKLDAEPAPAP